MRNIVFDKQWFKDHQKWLLIVINTWIGKWFFRIHKDVPKGKKITEITSLTIPHFLTLRFSTVV